MKSIKQRISDNQDFYNGVSVGVALGVIGAMLLVSRGVIVTIPMERMHQ